MKIFITGNNKKRNFYKVLNEVYSYLNNNFNIDISIDELFKRKDNCDLYSFDSLTNALDYIDLLLSIGGDGAILSIVRKMGKKQVPILGIHIGNLGFLNQSNKKQYKKHLDYILSKKNNHYNKYNILKSSFYDYKNNYKEVYCLNDFVITQNQNVRLLNLDVYVDNLLLNNFNSDGMIFSTPLGSTAYSLSAGGPIVNPDLESIIITAISPHRLSSRPIVLKSQSKVVVKFPINHPPTFLTTDGQKIYNLKNNSTINIQRSNYYAKFINVSNSDDYYEKLRDKLGW